MTGAMNIMGPNKDALVRRASGWRGWLTALAVAVVLAVAGGVVAAHAGENTVAANPIVDEVTDVAGAGAGVSGTEESSGDAVKEPLVRFCWQNEILSLGSVVFYFGGLLVFFRLLGKTGIYAWTVLCTIAANIEVLIVVRAFGLDTTLGNVIFASTFLATDILGELYGKREANRCVLTGVAANVAFIAISQSWFLYVPSEADAMAGPIFTVFSNTPRVMLASLAAYVACEIHDVWAYHAIWAWTERRWGDRRAFLWLRNNGSTLVSQFINVLAFNLLAFGGVFPWPVLRQILMAGYGIFVATSLLDTPFIYLARRMAERHPELLAR